MDLLIYKKKKINNKAEGKKSAPSQVRHFWDQIHLNKHAGSEDLNSVIITCCDDRTTIHNPQMFASCQNPDSRNA